MALASTLVVRMLPPGMTALLLHRSSESLWIEEHNVFLHALASSPERPFKSDISWIVDYTIVPSIWLKTAGSGSLTDGYLLMANRLIGSSGGCLCARWPVTYLLLG